MLLVADRAFLANHAQVLPWPLVRDVMAVVPAGQVMSLCARGGWNMMAAKPCPAGGDPVRDPPRGLGGQ